MKIKNIFLFGAILAVMPSCSDWLEQENLSSMTAEETYSGNAGIDAVASNLYTQLPCWQEFNTDSESYDICRWDEAINNSQYWSSAGNISRDYRANYNYTLIRNITQHIENLATVSAGKIEDNTRRYYLAEARWMRAYVYYRMAVQYGGVPLVTSVTPYTDNPAELAVSRNTEQQVYDFIISEMDAIKNDFGQSSVKTRATRGAALALKCRAALYAGSLARNFSISASKNLNLASHATGIPAEAAEGYFRKCLEAADEFSSLGYTLYANNSDLSQNYCEAFTVEPESNPEIIFCKAYDGNNVTNHFTTRAIPRSITAADRNKSACQINPVLNLVDCYELTASRSVAEIDAYLGDEQIELMTSSYSSEHYNLYDSPLDIFNGRDPRLAATVMLPGSSFRGKTIDLRAGLAIPDGNGYTFQSAKSKNNLDATFDGERMTGEDGPLCDGDGNWYISHTGFLLRKLVDPTADSELNGNSKVPYTIFRLGEVYLNACEAAYCLSQMGVNSYNGQNTADLALDYINRIRQRAGGTQFRLTAAELDFTRIINERRVELAFEDHRYDDLKRWRLADTIWHADEGSPTATLYVLWPYRIHAPGTDIHGKWLFRRMRAANRANNALISFSESMYYNTYPMTEGNPYIEPNPYQ